MDISKSLQQEIEQELDKFEYNMLRDRCKKLKEITQEEWDVSEGNQNGIITKLPTMSGFGANINKEIVDWNNCININIKILYNSKEYDVVIRQYDKEKQMLGIECFDNSELFYISTQAFKKGYYGTMLGLVRCKSYKHQIGDIVEINGKNIEILDLIRINSCKYGRRGYKYKCLNCNNEDTISEGDLNLNKGCNACCYPPRKIVKEINSVWKTHPQIIKYFKNINDAEINSIGSSKKIDFVCPRCGEIKRASLNNFANNLINNQFTCEKCGDTKSYPEKFMFNVLQQLGIKFECQQKFDWSENKVYDFFIPFNNTIIETHGMQHYMDVNGENINKRRSFEEEVENDIKKRELGKTQ